MDKRCLGCMEQYDSEYDICPHCGYVEGTAVDEAVHMEPGTRLVDRYVIGKVLGFGGFGVTYIGWDEKLEQKVAIKEYLPSEFSTRMLGQASVTIFNGEKQEQFQDGLNKFIEEAKRLSKFQNESGIVKIFDSFSANCTAYIAMEYLDGEILTSRLNRDGSIPEDEAVSMLLPVMNSLQTVHQEGILHRDIAPDNIFLTKDGEVKLIDFGASRYATTSHSRSLTVIIKPGYSPEEQYRSRGDQGPHTDVYALAATLYKAVTGITPPDALERRASIEAKKKDLLSSPRKLNSSISKVFENAILNAMNVQIEDRTSTIAEFCDELKSETPAARRYGKIKPIDFYSWPLWLKIVAPTCLAIILILGLLLGIGVIKFPSLFSDDVVVPQGMVIVPDIEGMDKDKALSEIEKVGLVPSPEGNVESEYVEVGKIVLQTPQGGTYLDKDGKVVLTVSSGKGVVEVQDGKATVPYVVWDTQENAIAKLKQAGLGEPMVKTQYDNNVDAGKVISQSVTAGEKVDEGTIITIVVSRGKKSTNTSSTTNTQKPTTNNEQLKISISQIDDFDLIIGDNKKINPTISPKTAITTWKSSDESIVTVNNGELVAVNAGIATITVSATENGTTKSTSFSVTVPNPVVTLNSYSGECRDSTEKLKILEYDEMGIYDMGYLINYPETTLSNYKGKYDIGIEIVSGSAKIYKDNVYILQPGTVKLRSVIRCEVNNKTYYSEPFTYTLSLYFECSNKNGLPSDLYSTPDSDSYSSSTGLWYGDVVEITEIGYDNGWKSCFLPLSYPRNGYAYGKTTINNKTGWIIIDSVAGSY